MAAHSQYSCLENPMDRGAWWATVHRVTKSRTRLSDLVHVHGWFLIQYNWHANKKRRLGHRHTQREDPMRAQREGDVDQSKRDASEETSPTDSLVLDFQPPEL